MKTQNALDSVGNTAKAICKGYAVGASGLAQVALFSAFVETANIRSINLVAPHVIVGLIIGAMTTFLFSSSLFRAVRRAAFQMIAEVRRQFKTIVGLAEGKAEPDYVRCIDISSKAALKGLFVPAIISIVAPLVVGFTPNAEGVGGFIIGNTASVLPMALLMMNSGTAWDNAKKIHRVWSVRREGAVKHTLQQSSETL